MFSNILAMYGVLFIEVSNAVDPRYFNFEKPDYSHSLYKEIMDIFTDSRNINASKAIGLISDNFYEFNFPIKRLHEDENSVILGQYEPVFTHSSFIEINCRQGETGEILNEILPRVVASYTAVVILKNSQDLYIREIEACMLEVFEKFWEKPMMNVVIMFPNNYKMSLKNSSIPFKIFAYVYEPYHEEPLRSVTEKSFDKIFYDKAANLHLHPLKVLAYERHRFRIEIEDGALQTAGIDGSLTEILDQIFNATIILMFRIPIELNAGKEDLYHSLEPIRNGSVDMWMNLCVIYPEIYEGVTYTYPRARMDIICVLPKYRDGPVEYKSIAGGRVLGLLSTMALGFSAVGFFVYLSNKLLLQKSPILKLVKVVLNQSDTVLQKTSLTTIRVLFGTWLFACLVYSTSLQTFITARIIRPSAEDRLTTIQDIIDLDIRLRIGERFWSITKNHYDEEILRGFEGNIDVVPLHELFKVQGPDNGYLTTKYTMQFINGEKTVYALEETILPNLAAYYFPEKSPLIRRFNRALAAITEAGITQKWETDNHHRFMLGLKPGKVISPVKYITYKHLKSVIYVYGIGMFIAFVVFICENHLH